MKKWKKYIYKSLFVFLILAAVLGSFNMLTGFAEGENKLQEVEVVVREGDTLWDLAINFGSSNKDVRKVIYQIEKRNRLKSSNIFPGQILIIPTK